MFKEFCVISVPLVEIERGDRRRCEAPGFRWDMIRSNGARRSTRRQMGASAWIRPDEGFSVRKCVISDISATGVRLFVDEQHLALKQFSLLMTRHQTHGCPCRVKWRRGTEIGAEFIAP
jgi:hypothetical protein